MHEQGGKDSQINQKDIEILEKNDQDTPEEIVVETNKAEGKKCSVCWKINKDKNF